MKTFTFLWPAVGWGDWITSCANAVGVNDSTLEAMIVYEEVVNHYGEKIQVTLGPATHSREVELLMRC